MSVTSFLLTALFTFYIETIFDFMGMGDVNEDFKVTTLGLSAAIMILYNMIAWPFIHESTNKKRPI